MLLDVLSYGNRPWIVAQHITAMFQGIKQLRMGGDPQALALTPAAIHILHGRGEARIEFANRNC
eukprot:5863930-Pleurochrysis_carterae.AAC.1